MEINELYKLWCEKATDDPDLTAELSKIENDEEKDFLDEDEKLDCECERCFKKISFEEYELNDFMCEDCYQDVHTDKHGNFHDDEYFDF